VDKAGAQIGERRANSKLNAGLLDYPGPRMNKRPHSIIHQSTRWDTCITKCLQTSSAFRGERQNPQSSGSSPAIAQCTRWMLNFVWSDVTKHICQTCNASPTSRRRAQAFLDSRHLQAIIRRCTRRAADLFGCPYDVAAVLPTDAEASLSSSSFLCRGLSPERAGGRETTAYRREAFHALPPPPSLVSDSNKWCSIHKADVHSVIARMPALEGEQIY
jgi:hypothetical protein